MKFQLNPSIIADYICCKCLYLELILFPHLAKNVNNIEETKLYRLYLELILFPHLANNVNNIEETKLYL